MGGLVGKVAIVTGAGQGVGRGIALALGKAGASVVVCGRTLAKCAQTVAEIEAAGGSAIAMACDVSVRDQVEQMLLAAIAAFGKLDILVNNAHTSRPLTLIEDTTVADLDLAFQGFNGMFHCMQAALPYLKQSRGVVINLGSVAGMRGDAGFSVYAAAKEAVRAFSRSAAREWGAFGIRVNVICPFSDSPGLDYMIRHNPEFVKALTAETALGRYGSSENDVGKTVVFLSGEGGEFITGQTLNVDGGIWIAP